MVRGVHGAPQVFCIEDKICFRRELLQDDDNCVPGRSSFKLHYQLDRPRAGDWSEPGRCSAWEAWGRAEMPFSLREESYFSKRDLIPAGRVPRLPARAMSAHATT